MPGVYGGKGVCGDLSTSCCVANFRPAVAGIPGVASPGLCEKKRSQERWDEHLSRTPGLASVHLGLASCESGMCVRKSAGIPGVAVLVCQRAFRVLQSWSVREKEEPGAMG